MIKFLAEGATSRAYLVSHQLTGKFFALKVIKKALSDMESIHRELEALVDLENCKFVVKLYEVYEDDRNLLLITEYVQGGELYYHLCVSKRLNIETVRSIMIQMISALECVHSQGFVHRDVKPENILMTPDGRIKICDFGCCKKLKRRERTYSITGSLDYLAPEMLSKVGYDFSVDLWGLGILCFELLTGYTPFYTGGNEQQTMRNIARNMIQFPLYMQEDAIDFIKTLTVSDPIHRSTLSEIKKHKFLRSSKSNSRINMVQSVFSQRQEISFHDEEGFSFSFESLVFVNISTFHFQ
jgi:serine/threonine protein kinase